jgi:multicomponent Na+:H+ antiporter subunit B
MPGTEYGERREAEPGHRRALGLVLVTGVVAVMALALAGEPGENAPLPGLARYAVSIAMKQRHTTETVNEIVYGTRAFDTFAETFLLLAAVVGISTITRWREPRQGFFGEAQAGQREQAESDPRRVAGQSEEQARQAEKREEEGDDEPPVADDEGLGVPGPERNEAMTVIIRAGARAVAPLLFMAGLYTVAWGFSPGGGFPAGAVVLGVVLLVYVSYGYHKVRRVVSPGLVEGLELAGALAIMAIEALGLVLKGSFSANWLPLGAPQTIESGGVLQAFSGAELVEVATGLTLAVFGLLAMRHDWSPDESSDDGQPGRKPQQ